MWKELLEVRREPGKFSVSGIKREETNFKKELVDLQHLLFTFVKGNGDKRAALKWLVAMCSHTLLMCMLDYRMQFKNRVFYLIKYIDIMSSFEIFKEMLKLHKHVKFPFFKKLSFWTGLIYLFLILFSHLKCLCLVF